LTKDGEKVKKEIMKCKRKLRIGTATSRGRKPILFGVPLKLMDALGWRGGETVEVIADTGAKTLTLEVVQDD
jgi:hypothetical protein